MRRETHPLISSQSHTTVSRNIKKSKYFLIGFLLSTLLAFIAFGLAQAIWIGYDATFKNECANSSTSDIMNTTTDITPTSTIPTTSTISPIQKCGRRIIAYHNVRSLETLTEKRISNLTHLILLTSLEIKNDSISFRIEREQTKLPSIVEVARKIPGLRIMFSIDGMVDYFHSNNIEYPENRTHLQNEIAAFMLQYQLDGIDLDCRGLFRLRDEDRKRYILPFCRELRARLSQIMEHRYIISAKLDPIDVRTEFGTADVDFVTVATVKLFGPRSPWRELIGPSSPLYSNLSSHPNNSVDRIMRKFSCWTKQPNKLNMMVDFSVGYWNNVKAPKNPSDTLWLTANISSNGVVDGGWYSLPAELPPNATISTPSLSYFAVELWNDDSKTPYHWYPHGRYVTFENERSLQIKVQYAIQKNIGGIAVMNLFDDAENGGKVNILSSDEFCSKNDNAEVKYNCYRGGYSE